MSFIGDDVQVKMRRTYIHRDPTTVNANHPVKFAVAMDTVSH